MSSGSQVFVNVFSDRSAQCAGKFRLRAIGFVAQCAAELHFSKN